MQPHAWGSRGCRGSHCSCKALTRLQQHNGLQQLMSWHHQHAFPVGDGSGNNMQHVTYTLWCAYTDRHVYAPTCAGCNIQTKLFNRGNTSHASPTCRACQGHCTVGNSSTKSLEMGQESHAMWQDPSTTCKHKASLCTGTAC